VAKFRGDILWVFTNKDVQDDDKSKSGWRGLGEEAEDVGHDNAAHAVQEHDEADAA